MADNMKRFLILLLIVLKEAGPTAACSSSCSSRCQCWGRGLTSVPQDLPTNITRLNLYHNSITTLNQSDFSRYSNLTRLQLRYNQMSVINSGAFYNLTRLTDLRLGLNGLTSLRADMFVGLDNLQELSLDYNSIHSIETGTFNAAPQLRTLHLEYNKLTSLRSDMFMGLEHLQHLDLSNNNIHSIETGTFNATPRLRELRLYNNSISSIAAGDFANLPLGDIDLADNDISTFPVEALSNLNTSLAWPTLLMNRNQMETLPSAAFDILASFRSVNINNNPWQCDCRMLPFKLRMNGSYPFENQITCVGPTFNLQGQLLSAVSPGDLICVETSTASEGVSVQNVSPQGFSLSAFLSGFLGGVVGSLLSSGVFLVIWYRITRKTSLTPSPSPAPPNRRAAPNPNPDARHSLAP